MLFKNIVVHDPLLPFIPLKFLLTPGIFLGVLFSQTFSESAPVHTYSIVAYDQETGELGVAVQSHWFSVGCLFLGQKQGLVQLPLNLL
ncbi:hypothetical protein Ct9H90mP29_18010 [bacterium]|nr:MAG: hypothetical protein Ct9H90mP29_18010 [bacterium]